MSTPPEIPLEKQSPATRPSQWGVILCCVLAVASISLSIVTWFREPDELASRRVEALELKIEVLERQNRQAQTRAESVESVAAPEPRHPARTESPAIPPAAAKAPPSVAAATPLAGSSPRAGSAREARFEIVANPELKGRLGRLVVEFPPADNPQERTELFKAGESAGLRTEFGNVAIEVTPGLYDINITGALVTGVQIESKRDTRMHVGVLRLNATGDTRFELFEAGGTRSLGTYFGQKDVGLPTGTYDVMVNGQRSPITVTRGTITDF
ncbi:MAG: hypothetical protein ACREIA_07385 [Opitutaceae bacterium]